MDTVIDLAIELLVDAGVHLAPGLLPGELLAVEQRFGFAFSDVHRGLLGRVLPLDGGGPARWPDWRSGSVDELRLRLDWPLDGVIFDVVEAGFWMEGWGPRPPEDSRAERVARASLRGLPPMIPLYGHRYLPSKPCSDDPPVFSIYQTDVIYYGDNLVDYLVREFKVGHPRPQGITADRRVPFWSDLVDL